MKNKTEQLLHKIKSFKDLIKVYKKIIVEFNDIKSSLDDDIDNTKIMISLNVFEIRDIIRYMNNCYLYGRRSD